MKEGGRRVSFRDGDISEVWSESGQMDEWAHRGSQVGDFLLPVRKQQAAPSFHVSLHFVELCCVHSVITHHRIPPTFHSAFILNLLVQNMISFTVNKFLAQ